VWGLDRRAGRVDRRIARISRYGQQQDCSSTTAARPAIIVGFQQQAADRDTSFGSSP